MRLILEILDMDTRGTSQAENIKGADKILSICGHSAALIWTIVVKCMHHCGHSTPALFI